MEKLMDGFLPKFFFNTGLLAVVRQQIQFQKKKITILALFLLSHNNPSSGCISSNYYPVLLAPRNTYYHGANASSVGFLVGKK